MAGIKSHMSRGLGQGLQSKHIHVGHERWSLEVRGGRKPKAAVSSLCCCFPHDPNTEAKNGLGRYSQQVSTVPSWYSRGRKIFSSYLISVVSRSSIKPRAIRTEGPQQGGAQLSQLRLKENGTPAGTPAGPRAPGFSSACF